MAQQSAMVSQYGRGCPFNTDNTCTLLTHTKTPPHTVAYLPFNSMQLYLILQLIRKVKILNEREEKSPRKIHVVMKNGYSKEYCYWHYVNVSTTMSYGPHLVLTR